MNQLLFPSKSKTVLTTALVGSTVILVPASHAQTATTNITSVTETITALGGIAAAITVVVLGGMGVRMAIKLVNRVSVKG